MKKILLIALAMTAIFSNAVYAREIEATCMVMEKDYGNCDLDEENKVCSVKEIQFAAHPSENGEEAFIVVSFSSKEETTIKAKKGHFYLLDSHVTLSNGLSVTCATHAKFN
ncbi:MAG: hypothetical protein KA715_12170 [Xanthomonadaceae bacterium]|nr:hypothetical protein [Xanthomonadaceae bacterium]